MDQARWEKIEELLQKALDLEPAARSAFVEHSCAGDEALCRKVKDLLSKEEEAENFIESPAMAGFVKARAKHSVASLIGRQVGRYRIEAHIGSGGMGDLYKAWDENTQRTVVLKTLTAEFTADAERVRRLEQEAFAASRLNHPNIITVFEVVHVDGAHFIATEYVEGKTVRDVLTDPQTKQPVRLSVEEAIDVARQVAGALKEAHTAWIIHRDIKPENIMVRKDGLVKVLDFGIAKLNQEQAVSSHSDGNGDRTNASQVGDGHGAHTLTVPGMIMGTASYMSPEQAQGEPLDGRTDLFSLGVILFEMVTGRRLLPGVTRAEALQAIQTQAEPLPANARFEGVPKELERIIRRTLRHKRDERYSSAGELLDDLNRLKHQLENRTSRRIVRFSLLAAVLTLAMTIVAAWFSFGDMWEEHVLRDGHTAAARKAAFSPDGKLLVTVAEDKQVIVWDFARRERLKTFSDHNGIVTSVAFSPDGKWFATGSYDQTVIVWDAQRLQQVVVLRDHRNRVQCLGFSPDGRWLVASASDANRTILWHGGSWEKGFEIPHSASEVANVLFSPDSKRLMFNNGISPNTWDLSTGRPVEDRINTSWSGNSAAVSSDGKHLASISPTGEVLFADLARRQTLGSFRAHQDHGRAVAYSPNGSLVVTGAENLILWDAIRRQKIAPLEYPSIVWSATFSPNGRWIVSTHGDGAVLVWDAAERQRIASFNEHSGGVRGVAFSGDGKRIVSASEDGSVIIWDTERRQKETVLSGHQTRVMGVAMSADGRRVVSADQDGVIKLWDVSQRRLLWSIKPASKYAGPNYCAALSPDGRWVATSNGVYESDSGHEVLELAEIALNYGAQIYAQAFSNDGRLLACSMPSGWLLIWDTRTWQLVAQERLSTASLVAVSFAPDGQWLVTGEEDPANLRLWQTHPLKQVAVLGKHMARIKAVAFSPDGRQVASAGDDKMVALWDVNRRKLITRIGTHASPVYAVAFSPDGRRLVSGEHDHSVRLYTRHQTLLGFKQD